MTHDKLLETISSLDGSMRTRARQMCGDIDLGDDIWHDTVIKILTTYIGPELIDKNISGLIYSTMLSVFLDHKKKRSISDKCVELKFAEQEIVDNDYAIYGKLAVHGILDYLNSINDKHRNVFLMSVFGMDNDSIAKQLSESNENVKKIVHRTRSKIKNLFKNERSYF